MDPFYSLVNKFFQEGGGKRTAGTDSDHAVVHVCYIAFQYLLMEVFVNRQLPEFFSGLLRILFQFLKKILRICESSGIVFAESCYAGPCKGSHIDDLFSAQLLGPGNGIA